MGTTRRFREKNEGEKMKEKKMFKIGTTFRDKYGDWTVTSHYDTKHKIYEIRGDSGTIAQGQYDLERWYKKVKK